MKYGYPFWCKRNVILTNVIYGERFTHLFCGVIKLLAQQGLHGMISCYYIMNRSSQKEGILSNLDALAIAVQSPD